MSGHSRLIVLCSEEYSRRYGVRKIYNWFLKGVCKESCDYIAVFPKRFHITAHIEDNICEALWEEWLRLFASHRMGLGIPLAYELGRRVMSNTYKILQYCLQDKA